MADILNTNPTNILESFQNAYYEQIGKRMMIGSEEYTISSVFTYAMAHYAELINASYRNQNIATASGEFLDNIAARYNLHRKPDVYSNPWFETACAFNYEWEGYGRHYNKGELEIEISGHIYVNTLPIENAAGTIPMKFICTEAHEDALSKDELINELKNNGTFIPSNVRTYNVAGLESVSTELSDADFRKYIQNSLQLYTPGVAGSFEAIAKAYSPNFADVHTIVQGEKGFTPGHVEVIYKPLTYELGPNEESTLANDVALRFANLDGKDLESVIAEAGLAVVGQNVMAHAAPKRTMTITNAIFWKYPTYDTESESELNELYLYKFMASCGYVNRKLTPINNRRSISNLVTNVMMQPLTNISDNPFDYGLVPGDVLYDNFDRYKDLPVAAVTKVDVPGVTDPTHLTYPWIDVHASIQNFHINNWDPQG